MRPERPSQDSTGLTSLAVPARSTKPTGGRETLSQADPTDGPQRRYRRYESREWPHYRRNLSHFPPCLHVFRTISTLTPICVYTDCPAPDSAGRTCTCKYSSAARGAPSCWSSFSHIHASPYSYRDLASIASVGINHTRLITCCIFKFNRYLIDKNS